MYKHTLVGNKYIVVMLMRVESYTTYSRGDHGMGGGDYTVYYGTGEVTVRDLAGHAVAACRLYISNKTNEQVDETTFKRCVDVKGLLPEREKAYADWTAEKIIERFREPNPGGGMLSISLTEPDYSELIRMGFVLDSEGQSSLPLYDVLSSANT